MAKVTKFYDSYERVVTPTSKNIVLEYKGGSSAWFTFNVDISGKNANKYDLRYQNIATRSGDDLVITTVFISLKGSEKIVTTTVKNYFIENLLQEINIKSTLLKDETICIDQYTKFGVNGLYGQVGDGPYSDYILAPDDTSTINLTNSGYDQVFDKTGDDIYYANGGMTEYFLDLNGNDSYNSSKGNITTIRDTKGDDKYLSDNPSTKISTIDYKGNDEYKALDSAKIHSIDYNGNDKYILEDDGSFSLAQDIKGNDEYYLGSHTASNIQDNSGNDKYTFVNAWVTTDSNIIEDRYGNDKYDIETSIAVGIADYGGKDEYKIKDIDTSSNDYVNANFIIVDYSGNDKYELENISSSEEQTRSHISDELGNDSYLATNVNHVSFYDKKGNDKYNFISGKNATIYDWLGKDTYTLKGTETEKLMQLTINDMDTSKKTASDKYILEKTDYVTITDNAGNDKYTLNDSNYVEISDTKGSDSYKLIGTETNKVRNTTITDESGNDKYNLQYLDSSSISSKNLIEDEEGNDSYTIANSWNILISENKGKDKYTFVGDNHNLSIRDDEGSDTYISKKGLELLSCTYIYDSGTNNDTYSLSGFDTGLIEDEGGNNKFNISDSCELTINAIGQGNDKYNLKNIEYCGIKDAIGNDKYTILTCTDAKITDGLGADSYTVKGSYNKKTKETTYVKNITIEDRSIENDTYYFDKVYGVPEVNTISDEGGSDKYSIKDTMFVSIKDNNGNDKYSFNGQIINTEIDDLSGIDFYSNNSKSELKCIVIDDKGADNDTYTLNGGDNLSITDEGGNNKFTISNCYESGIEATGNGNDTYKYTNMYDCWIEDYDGNDNYNINKSWLSNIEDDAGSDVYKIVKSTDINIVDNDGNDTYTIDIKGIKNGHYYIKDDGSDIDSLTISGLSAKNVVYLTNIDKNGNTTGDLIILDKSSKSYIQMDLFFNTDGDWIHDEFDVGCIETIKAGKTTLKIDAFDMSNHLNCINETVASWLSSGEEYDSVVDVLNSGDKNVINELIAYCQQ